MVSAFTYIRNGFTYGYPFMESIQSLLPIVDEYIVVIGRGNDGTREAVAALNDAKIKIIDTVWDEALRTGGKIFAQQANIGMDNCRKDAQWLFHLQADEVLHEKDLPLLLQALQAHKHDRDIDGLLFPFIHFFGDYHHYCPSRRFHKYEIRVIKNNPHIRSFKDSMGFRKYLDPSNQEAEKGEKLKVALMPAPVYHYSWATPPKTMVQKRISFIGKYTETDDYINAISKTEDGSFNYYQYDYLRSFTGTHPAVMQPRVAAQDWHFVYDPKRNNMSPKEKILKWVESLTGKQLFTYRNYKRIK